MIKVENIVFTFDSVKESTIYVYDFMMMLVEILHGYNYGDYLDKVEFVKSMDDRVELGILSGGCYFRENKQILIKDDAQIKTSMFHELLHVKFSINNSCLLNNITQQEYYGYHFIDEYFAYRDSKIYIFENSNDNYKNQIIREECNSLTSDKEFIGVCKNSLSALNTLLLENECKIGGLSDGVINEIYSKAYYLKSVSIIRQIDCLARIQMRYDFVNYCLKNYSKRDNDENNLTTINKYMLNLDREKITLRNCDDIYNLLCSS